MTCKYCKQEHEETELCKPTRRSFFFLGFASLAAIAVGKVTLDKLVSNEFDCVYMSESDIISAELDKIMKRVPELFERDDVFFSTLKEKNLELVSERTIRVPFKVI